jgi:hypothetical protein
MVVPIAGVQHSGFLGDMAPITKMTGILHSKYRYLVLNNTGITP